MRYTKMNDKEIWSNPYFHPNPLVYKIQCKAFGLFVSKIFVSRKVKMNERALKENIKKLNKKTTPHIECVNLMW